MDTLLWAYLRWRRFPRDLSGFEVRRFSSLNAPPLAYRRNADGAVAPVRPERIEFKNMAANTTLSLAGNGPEPN